MPLQGRKWEVKWAGRWITAGGLVFPARRGHLQEVELREWACPSSLPSQRHDTLLGQQLRGAGRVGTTETAAAAAASHPAHGSWQAHSSGAAPHTGLVLPMGEPSSAIDGAPLEPPTAGARVQSNRLHSGSNSAAAAARQRLCSVAVCAVPSLQAVGCRSGQQQRRPVLRSLGLVCVRAVDIMCELLRRTAAASHTRSRIALLQASSSTVIWWLGTVWWLGSRQHRLEQQEAPVAAYQLRSGSRLCALTIDAWKTVAGGSPVGPQYPSQHPSHYRCNQDEHIVAQQPSQQQSAAGSCAAAAAAMIE